LSDSGEQRKGERVARIDVVFGPPAASSADLAGRVVAVIDVLRASTSIAVALVNGAKAVIPFESAEDAVLRSRNFERPSVRLAGERRMRPIAGFDLGNSPAEFTREAVEGKTILFTTTNGTAALLAVQGARDVVVASYVNFSAIVALLRSALRGGTDVAIVCAGRERQFALEDGACAGRFIRFIRKQLPDTVLDDGARACAALDQRYGDDVSLVFAEAEHAQALADAGYAADLTWCAAIDSYPVVPVYQERQITKLGPGRER
jgi:2-phosphosulfolactate phosphatase